MAESKNSIISLFNHLNEYKPSSRQKSNITIRFPDFSLKCLLGVVQRTELAICLFRVFIVVCKKIRERNSFGVFSTSAFRKTADMKHWGQPLWIHWEVCQYWGLMAICCESTGTKSIAARFFPSQYTWQNYLQVAYLNLARSQLFQDPIEQKSSPVSWGRSHLKLYRVDDLSDRVCNTCSGLPLFQCVWLVTVFQWQCFYGLCLEFTLSWHSLPHNVVSKRKWTTDLI